MTTSKCPVTMGTLHRRSRRFEAGSIVVIWQLVLLVQVHPHTPRFLPPVLILVNVLPVAGVRSPRPSRILLQP